MSDSPQSNCEKEVKKVSEQLIGIYIESATSDSSTQLPDDHVDLAMRYGNKVADTFEGMKISDCAKAKLDLREITLEAAGRLNIKRLDTDIATKFRRG